jgi:signal transduction histidine kinase
LAYSVLQIFLEYGCSSIVYLRARNYGIALNLTFRSIPLEPNVAENIAVNIDFQKLTILIIDDAPADRDSYRCYILSDRTQTERTSAASYPIEALDLCREYSPDLILLNFCRDDAQERDFLTALQSQAGEYLLPPIGSLRQESAGEDPIGKTLNLVNLATVASDNVSPPVTSAPEHERLLQPCTPQGIDRSRDLTDTEAVGIPELANTSQPIEQKDRELNAFVSVTSGDLRAALKGIANLSTWLEEDLEQPLTPDTRQQFDLLQSRVRRMTRTIEDLLQYARVGQQPMSKARVNVGELLTQIIAALGVPPQFTIAIASEMPTIRTERGLLQQVLRNLICNAIEHHDRPNGRVEIFAHNRADGHLFEIVDDGPEIATSDRERIFEVFPRLKPNGETNTGLGLAIAKKTIELQGGEIWFEANAGAGSKFSFTWPTAPLYL